MKFAVISHVLPPASSGQSVVLSRLLRELPPDEYCLLSRQVPTAGAQSPDVMSPLPAVTARLPAPPTMAPALAGPARVAHLLRQARSTVRAVRAHGSEAIVACSGELYDIPASYLASRWLGLPFYAYLFDDYVLQWTSRGKRLFARAAEAAAIRGAAGVVVPNEFLADVYRRRHGVAPTIVRNPFDPAHAAEPSPRPPQRATDGLQVVFTGSVYHAHFDEFRRLAAALAELPGAHLHVYTAQDPEVFRRERIVGPVTVHPQVTPGDAAAIQRGADVLFLPLGFSSPIPEVVRTAAPGKLGDYLRAGTVVLAHAPPDSFVAHWFRRRGCGLLVDRPDAAALTAALRRLREEPGLRDDLAGAARGCAEEFSVEAARGALFDLLRRGGHGARRPTHGVG